MIQTQINDDNNRIEFLDNLKEFHETEVLKNMKKIAGLQQCDNSEDDLSIDEVPLSHLPQSSQN